MRGERRQCKDDDKQAKKRFHLDSSHGKQACYNHEMPLLAFLLLYAAASLFHYAHNAQFLADYPNLLMNLTIWLEAASAALLLAAVGSVAVKHA